MTVQELCPWQSRVDPCSLPLTHWAGTIQSSILGQASTQQGPLLTASSFCLSADLVFLSVAAVFGMSTNFFSVCEALFDYAEHYAGVWDFRGVQATLVSGVTLLVALVVGCWGESPGWCDWDSKSSAVRSSPKYLTLLFAGVCMQHCAIILQLTLQSGIGSFSILIHVESVIIMTPSPPPQLCPTMPRNEHDVGHCILPGPPATTNRHSVTTFSRHTITFMVFTHTKHTVVNMVSQPLHRSHGFTARREESCFTGWGTRRQDHKQQILRRLIQWV